MMSDQHQGQDQQSQQAQQTAELQQKTGSMPQSSVQVPARVQPMRYHVHHSYIWLGSIRMLFIILAFMFFSTLSSLSGVLEGADRARESGILSSVGIGIAVIVVFVLIVGIVSLYQWFSYRHLYYELGGEEFNLYSGILNKKRVHVPYQRVQSVNQSATLVQRVFGVCTVHIDTAGGASNKAVVVPYIQKGQAEQLRTELFARKHYAVIQQSGIDPAAVQHAAVPVSGTVPDSVQVPSALTGMPGQPANILDAPAEIWQDLRGVFGGAAISTGRVTYEYGLTNKELVLTGLSNNTAFVLIVIGVLGAISQFISSIGSIFFGHEEELAGQVVATGSRLFGGDLLTAGIVVVVGAVAFMWLVSIIATCISYGGFRACRRDNRIEVEHGLLQHRFQGVDIDRVQSVIVKQSFIRRIFGYCELSLGKIDAMSDSSEEQRQSMSQQGLIVHPFVKMNRVPDILAGLVPEFADVPVQNTPVAPVALRRALIRRCIIQGVGFWLAVIVVIGQIVANTVIDPSMNSYTSVLFYINTGAVIAYALSIVLLAFDAAAAVLWFRASGFAYNEHFMQVSNGGLSRETISFPRKKIQFGYTKTNPFQRHAGTVTVNARTAAGVIGTTIRLIDVCEKDAMAWLDWLKPRGDVVQ